MFKKCWQRQQTGQNIQSNLSSWVFVSSRIRREVQVIWKSFSWLAVISGGLLDSESVCQSESVHIVCVSMLAHWASTLPLIVLYLWVKLSFLSQRAAQWKRLFSVSCHCTASVPSQCPHAEKGTCFRMLRRVSRIAGLGVKHWLNLCQLVILRAYLFVCCFPAIGEGTTIYFQKLFLLPWVIQTMVWKSCV